MTSNSSKALPYVALLVLVASLFVEVHYDTDVDLETAIPFLMALGLGGAGLKAVERAAKARNALAPEFEKIIKQELHKILAEKSKDPKI